MRPSATSVIGVAVALVSATFSAAISPSLAGPSYNSDQVLDVFLRQKAAADAFKAQSKTRAICIGTAADCPTPKPPAQTNFDLLVTFDFNSDQLTQTAKENLDQFAKALEDPRLKGEKFEIDGHTDATGTEIYNQDLSERRANAVAAYLESRGLEPSNLIARGFGKTKPRVANPYSPENRRVEAHLSQ